MNFTCPFCERDQAVTPARYSAPNVCFSVEGNVEGKIGAALTAITCANNACLIRELSPKASATLVRRCLQGMIRDFCGIQRSTLNDEISTLRAQVDAGSAPVGVSHETVDAIDHVRSIGNIGAHMEKDIDVIVPVEPSEAGILIGLVEMLFDEWYVARDRRRTRLEGIKAIADNKKAIKAIAKAINPPALPPASD